MPSSVLVRDCKRSPITLPGYRAGMSPPNKGKSYPAEVLSRSEIARLMAATSRHGSAGIRDRALIVVMWRAGLRIAEALALKPHDVDLDAGTIAVLHGKGDRRRVVGVDPDAIAVLEHWLQRRRELHIGPSKPLFCTITKPHAGSPLKDSCFRETLKLLARRAAIEKRVHPHGLRHTHAAELAMEGVPLHVIRRQLGHSSLATTERYIDHLTPADVIAIMQQRRWVSHEPPPVHAEHEHDAAIGGPTVATPRQLLPAIAA